MHDAYFWNVAYVVVRFCVDCQFGTDSGGTFEWAADSDGWVCGLVVLVLVRLFLCFACWGGCNVGTGLCVM